MRPAIRKSAAILALLVLGLSACARGSEPADDGPIGAAVGEEQATEMADSLLQGFNAGDYATFSRGWSEAMKEAIKESDFQAFREDTLGSAGKFQTISEVDLVRAKTPGHVTYVFSSQFERAVIDVRLTFKEDGNLIEGVTFEPAEG